MKDYDELKPYPKKTIRITFIIFLLVFSLSAWSADYFLQDRFIAEGTYSVLGTSQDAVFTYDYAANRIGFDTMINEKPWTLRMHLSANKPYGFIQHGANCVDLNMQGINMPSLAKMNQFIKVPETSALPRGISLLDDTTGKAIIIIKADPVIVYLTVKKVKLNLTTTSNLDFSQPKGCDNTESFYGVPKNFGRKLTSKQVNKLEKKQPYIEANRNWTHGSQPHVGKAYRVNFNTTGRRVAECNKQGKACKLRVDFTNGFFGYNCGAGRSSNHEPLTCTDQCCKLHDLKKYNWCGLHNCLKCYKNSSWWDWTTKFGNDYDAHFVVNTYAVHKCKDKNKAKCK